MKNLEAEINQIIREYFEKDFFFGYSEPILDKLKEKINDFDKNHHALHDGFLNTLKNKFPTCVIEDLTQLFNLDRCFRFLVQKDECLRFVCQISIFGFFSVYQRPMHFEADRYEYGEISFIDYDETEFCNNIFACLISNAEDTFVWLPKRLLTRVIEDFSITVPELNIRHEIRVADALFTSHYV